MRAKHPGSPRWMSTVSRGGWPLPIRGTMALVAAGLLVSIDATAASRLAFVTSTEGTAILGEWSEAGGNVGLAAGDAICVARATAANLPEPQAFVAWLSDSNNDAYCRVYGFTGKKSAQCGQASLPIGAGPWQRTDGMPFMDTFGSGSPVAAVYLPLARDELGQAVPNARIFTGTVADGGANGRLCGNWQGNGEADIGETSATYPGWTQLPGYNFCSSEGRLACLQKGTGDALPPRPRAHKLAFVTSMAFTGNLDATALASGNTGIAAGDSICRNLAQAANVPDAETFKAYLPDGAHSTERFEYDGPWQRLDGVKFADSLAQLRAGLINAPLSVMETGGYTVRPDDFAWSAIDPNGNPTQDCTQWTLTTGFGRTSRLDTAGPNWPRAHVVQVHCGTSNRLYCLSDSDVIFRTGME